MVNGLRRKAMSLPGTGNGERSTNHDADLPRFSICWVQSHETRRNQCFKIDLPKVNQINLHCKTLKKHVQQQKTTKKHIFQTIKHILQALILLIHPKNLPETRPPGVTFTRHAEGTITEPSLSRSFKALLSSDRGLANQQLVGRCSSYLPPNHPCLVYLIYIYGWSFILTTVGWTPNTLQKRWNKKIHLQVIYQDTILPTWNGFKQLHSLKLTKCLRLKEMESPKRKA